MRDTSWLTEQATLTLERLCPRLHALFSVDSDERRAEWSDFERRLSHEWPRLFPLLFHLYGAHYDFFFHVEQLLHSMARSWLGRSTALKALDRQREADPEWALSHRMVGGVVYVDLFAGDLAGVRERIPYFQELGLTYLHLMPFFEAPDGPNDGGYAISDYRRVEPALGTMEELGELASALRAVGISLVVDFVFNHTSDEHLWAQRARAGDRTYQRFYLMYDDRTLPDQYERTLREIFPTERRGSFTWEPVLQKWVWTTFHSYQWDLNYSNPDVFRAMADEMMFLANQGVEVLRMDAVAFIWKRMGTTCENEPEAHMLIQAFNAVTRIACPALYFKSEAIVHPDEVIKYISPGEAQLSYNPLLMALLWEALATRDVRLLAHSVQGRSAIPPRCTWVNYLRCHDDIGWTFDDNDARRLGIDPVGHRNFLNAFYTGTFPGSFARGVPFQANPETGDQRISGTLASLAGVEKALAENDPQQIELALDRILMLHGVILSIGGIPLLYLGDEWGVLNDYSYHDDPSKAHDSRWIHRPTTDWARGEQRTNPRSVVGRLFGGLQQLTALRTSEPVFWGTERTILESHNRALFAYRREHEGEKLICVANFTEHPHHLLPEVLDPRPGVTFHDLVSERTIQTQYPIPIAPYQLLWLKEG